MQKKNTFRKKKIVFSGFNNIVLCISLLNRTFA